jgi:hypothetical protein
MARYRCDFRDDQGRIFSTHEIEALDDDEAIAKGRELCSRSEFDLWCGETLIRRSEREPVTRALGQADRRRGLSRLLEPS